MSSKGDAMKHDEGKPRIDLVPKSAVIAIAKVMEYGAKKYEEHDWRKGYKWTRAWSAAQRHLWAWIENESIDSESGISHLSHAIAALAILQEFESNTAKYGELDDRFGRKNLEHLEKACVAEIFSIGEKELPNNGEMIIKKGWGFIR